jgi:hypothetical protein
MATNLPTTPEQSDKPHIFISNRAMHIPEPTQKIGVAGDRYSESVGIDLPLYYDGFYLASGATYVESVDASGAYDISAPDKTVQSDRIVLKWVVPPTVSSSVGVHKVRVRVTNGEDFVWLTQTGVLTVSETFNTDGGTSDDSGLSVVYDKLAEIDDMIARVNEAIANANAAAAAVSDKRYGVSWTPGQSSPTLTRIWDAAGMVAQVGTDVVDTTYQNDFDTIAPFNRRRCCGDFDANGVMQIVAYDGEPGFATDGSAGNVWVEDSIGWYFQDLDNGQLGVAPQDVAVPGWAVHPKFITPSGEILTKKYSPAYNMSVVSGVAKSISGQHCRQGSINSLMTDARTYSSSRAHLETLADRHWEWLLFTIEFATKNSQAIMGGASGMPYSATDKISLSGANVNAVVVPANVGDKFSWFQTIYIGAVFSTTDVTSAAYNKITSIAPCDETGAVTSGGSYRLITFDGTPRTVTGGTTAISSRPWKTGACDSVKYPSGVANGGLNPATDVKHNCRYRYRESPFGNIFSGCSDILVTRTGDGSGDPYLFHWNLLADPTKYNNGTLTADYTEVGTNSIVTNGYIKAASPAQGAPQLLIPTDATGGSTTYDCDYYWYPTAALTASGFGGFLFDGAYDGLRALLCSSAPSDSFWNRGGSLYLSQTMGA